MRVPAPSCSIILAFAALVIGGRGVADDIPPKEPPRDPAVPFVTVTSLIADAEASGELNDPSVLTEFIHNIVARVRENTRLKHIKAPVTFDEIGGDAKEHVTRLYVAKDIDLSHVQKALILSTGNVTISHARDCVIIADGNVRIVHSNRNIIVATKSVRVSHDGNDALRDVHDRAAAQFHHGSVILCGHRIEISHARGTVCTAPYGLTISQARHVLYLRSPNRNVSSEDDGCREAPAVGIPVISTAVKAKEKAD